jgi:hypothetical protein
VRSVREAVAWMAANAILPAKRPTMKVFTRE